MEQIFSNRKLSDRKARAIRTTSTFKTKERKREIGNVGNFQMEEPLKLLHNFRKDFPEIFCAI